MTATAASLSRNATTAARSAGATAFFERLGAERAAVGGRVDHRGQDRVDAHAPLRQARPRAPRSAGRRPPSRPSTRPTPAAAGQRPCASETLTIAPPSGSRRAASRHDHQAVPRLRSARKRTCVRLGLGDRAGAEPAGGVDHPAGRELRRLRAASQSAATSSAEVRSTASCERPGGGLRRRRCRSTTTTRSPRASSAATIAPAERAAATADERDVGHRSALAVGANLGEELAPQLRVLVRRRARRSSPSATAPRRRASACRGATPRGGRRPRAARSSETSPSAICSPSRS